MAAIAWDCLKAHVAVTGGADADHSASFVMPRSTGAITIFIPALDGSGTTLTLQSLNPLTDVYADVTVFNLADGAGSPVTLDGMPENSCITLPASAIGPGNFRFTFSASQTTAANIVVLYDRL